MEPIFKNLTEYTNELYNEYLKFYRKKYGIQEIIIGILSVFVLINLIIMGLKIFKWASILIWLAFICAVYLYQKYRENIQKVVSKITKQHYSYIIRRKNKGVQYKFYNSYFEATYKGEQDRVSYLNVKKVFEFSNRYYLIINKNYSFIVLKDGFTKGTAEEFKDFIKTKGNFIVKEIKEKNKKLK